MKQFVAAVVCLAQVKVGHLKVIWISTQNFVYEKLIKISISATRQGQNTTTNNTHAEQRFAGEVDDGNYKKLWDALTLISSIPHNRMLFTAAAADTTFHT